VFNCKRSLLLEPILVVLVLLNLSLLDNIHLQFTFLGVANHRLLNVPVDLLCEGLEGLLRDGLGFLGLWLCFACLMRLLVWRLLELETLDHFI